jgi:hypothetical protein
MYTGRLAALTRPGSTSLIKGRFFSETATDGQFNHRINPLCGSINTQLAISIDIRGRLLSELKTAMKVRCLRYV